MVGRRLLADGEVLGEFQVRRLAGFGSVTQVYEVNHTRTGRAYALKCLDAVGSTGEERARFQAGVKALMALRHEGFPPVLEGGFTGGKLWFVQELVGGRFVIREDAEPHWIKTCGWALPASQALQAASEKGILHGDLSPESIVLSDDGAPRVLGIGGHNLYGFSADVVLETPAFRSPEQRAGLPIDARSDIYSFGLLMYASLTGTGAAPEEVRSFTEVPACPRAVAEIVAKCAQRDPAQRFSSWEELESLLRTVALHQIMNPDAILFEAPSSGVRGRDELEGATRKAGKRAKPTEERRDTLESIPHVVPFERSAPLTVVEPNPGDAQADPDVQVGPELEAGSEDAQTEGGDVGEGVVEEGVTGGGRPNLDDVPTPRVVGLPDERRDEEVAPRPRPRRTRLKVAALVVAALCAFFFLFGQEEPALLVARPVVIPKVTLPEVPPESVPSAPEPETAPPSSDPALQPETEREQIAQLRAPSSQPRVSPLSASPPVEPSPAPEVASPAVAEPAPSAVAEPAPPPVDPAVQQAAKTLSDMCGFRCVDRVK